MKKHLAKVLSVLTVAIIGILANKGFAIATVLDKTLLTIGIIFITYITYRFIKTLYVVLFKYKPNS